MAFRHGRNTQLFLGTTELSTYLDNVDRSLDIDTSDVTTFGTAWHAFIAGLMGQTMSVSGSFDGTAAAALESAANGGTAWPIKYFPGGSASGQRQVSYSGFLTNYSESSPVADKVGLSFEILATGTVTSTTL